jgi:hypothetical protein
MTTTTTTAMFLWAGFMSAGALDRDEADDLGGQIGAAHELLPWADRIDAALELADEKGLEYPGVFAYEVVEPLGKYLRSVGCRWDEGSAYQCAKTIAAFFERDDQSARDDLRVSIVGLWEREQQPADMGRAVAATLAGVDLALRDYFIAHAPAEPQPWFQPVMATERPMVPTIFELSAEDRRDWNDERLDNEPDACSPALHDFQKRQRQALNAGDAWDAEQKKLRYVQWPGAWADAQIALRGGA